jgi:lipoate-protein ligase A
MRYDEELARSLAAAEGPCTVRVYGWQPPALSLGWHQSSDDVDVRRCADAGIDIVRRPTGGRAILHSDEVTYSVVMTSDRAGVLETYRRISDALVQGLRLIGVDARLERSQPHFPSLYKLPSSLACFASAARHEIHVDGKKLVGSAQRRFARSSGDEVVLQHGSILLGPDHLRIVQLLKISTERERELLREELVRNTTDLSAALGRRVGFEEVADAVRAGFERSWGITFTSRMPEDPEIQTLDSQKGHAISAS